MRSWAGCEMIIEVMTSLARISMMSHFGGGIDLDLQRLPKGPDYAVIRDAGVVVLSANEQVKQRWEEDLRAEVEAVLGGLMMEITGGQKDLFIRLSQLCVRTPEVAERLAVLLTHPDAAP